MDKNLKFFRGVDGQNISNKKRKLNQLSICIAYALALLASHGVLAEESSDSDKEAENYLQIYSVNAVSNNAVLTALSNQDSAVLFKLEKNNVSLIYAAKSNGNFEFQGVGSESLQIDSLGGGLKVNDGKTLSITNIDSLIIGSDTDGASTNTMTAVCIENGKAILNANDITLTSGNYKGLGTVNNKSKLSMSGKNLIVIKELDETHEHYSDFSASALQTDGSNAESSFVFENIYLSANSKDKRGVIRNINSSTTNISADLIKILGTRNSVGIESSGSSSINIVTDEITIRAANSGIMSSSGSVISMNSKGVSIDSAAYGIESYKTTFNLESKKTTIQSTMSGIKSNSSSVIKLISDETSIDSTTDYGIESDNSTVTLLTDKTVINAFNSGIKSSNGAVVSVNATDTIIASSNYGIESYNSDTAVLITAQNTAIKSSSSGIKSNGGSVMSISSAVTTIESNSYGIETDNGTVTLNAENTTIQTVNSGLKSTKGSNVTIKSANASISSSAYGIETYQSTTSLDSKKTVIQSTKSALKSSSCAVIIVNSEETDVDTSSYGIESDNSSITVNSEKAIIHSLNNGITASNYANVAVNAASADIQSVNASGISSASNASVTVNSQKTRIQAGTFGITANNAVVSIKSEIPQTEYVDASDQDPNKYSTDTTEYINILSSNTGVQSTNKATVNLSGGNITIGSLTKYGIDSDNSNVTISTDNISIESVENGIRSNNGSVVDVIAVDSTIKSETSGISASNNASVIIDAKSATIQSLTSAGISSGTNSIVDISSTTTTIQSAGNGLTANKASINLTAENTTINAQKNGIYANNAAVINVNSSDFTINSSTYGIESYNSNTDITIESKNAAIYASNSGIKTNSGSAINLNSEVMTIESGSYGIESNNTDSIVTVNTEKTTITSSKSGIKSNSSSAVNITSEEINIDSSSSGIESSNSIITIKAGNAINIQAKTVGITASSSATVTLNTDSTNITSVDSTGIASNSYATITVNSQKLTLDSGSYGITSNNAAINLNAGKTIIQSQKAGISAGSSALIDLNTQSITIESKSNGIESNNSTINVDSAETVIQSTSSGISSIKLATISANLGNTNIEAGSYGITADNSIVVLSTETASIQSANSGIKSNSSSTISLSTANFNIKSAWSGIESNNSTVTLKATNTVIQSQWCGISSINGSAVTVDAYRAIIQSAKYPIDSYGDHASVTIGTAGKNQYLKLISGHYENGSMDEDNLDWAIRVYRSASVNIQAAYVESNSGFLAKTADDNKNITEIDSGGTITIGSFDEDGKATTKSVNISLENTYKLLDSTLKSEGRGQISIISEKVSLSNPNGLALLTSGKHGIGETIKGGISINATDSLSVTGNIQAENTGGTDDGNTSYTGTYIINLNTDERANGDVKINGNLITKDTNESTVLINLNLRTADSVLNGAILNTNKTGSENCGTNLGISNGATWNVTGNSQVKSITADNATINATDKTITVDTVTTDDLTIKTSVVKESQFNIGTLNTHLDSTNTLGSEKSAIKVQYSSDAIKNIDYSDLPTVANKQIVVNNYNILPEPETSTVNNPETDSAIDNDESTNTWESTLTTSQTDTTTEEDSQISNKQHVAGTDTVSATETVTTDSTQQVSGSDSNHRVDKNAEVDTQTGNDSTINSVVTVTKDSEKNTIDVVNQVVVSEGAVDGIVTVGTDDDGNTVVNVQTNTAIQAVSDINGFNYLTFRSNINDLDKRLGDIRIMPKSTGLWARYYAGQNKYGTSNLKTNYRSVQMGIDTFIHDKYYLGVALGYKDADSSSTHSSSSEKNYNFSLYTGWLGEKGQFIDLIVKRHRILTSFQAINNERLNYKGSYGTWGNSVSLEGGWRIRIPSSGFYIEPSLELKAGHINGVTYSTGNGVTINQKHTRSLIGRAGVAAGFIFPNDKGSMYIKASVLHDWQGKTQLTATDGNRYVTLKKNLGGTWGEFAAGGTYRITKKLSAYGEAQTSAGSPTRNPWQFSIGLRYSF